MPESLEGQKLKVMQTPVAVANYFIQKSFDTGEELTPMKVLKLVYIAHGWNLGVYGNALINEAVMAWKYGPVVESVYHEFKRFYNNQITQQATEFNQNGEMITPFPVKQSHDLLNTIWDVYGKYNGLQLSTLTHEPNTPWDIVWNRMDGKNRTSAIIPNAIIEQHYKDKVTLNANKQ